MKFVQVSSERQVLALILWLGPVSCSFNVGSIPVDEQRDAGRTHEDAGIPDAGRARDAGPVEDSGADAGSDAALSLRNPLCTSALPNPLPDEPLIARDATGKPVFDRWRELDCADDAVKNRPYCTFYLGGDPACDVCVGEQQVCLAAPVEMSSTCAPLVTGSPVCTVCVPPEAKRQACCAGQDTFCDEWPFHGTSPLGGPCAVHADCEGGLVCQANSKATAPDAFGICSCPDGYERPSCWTKRVP